MLNQDVTVDFSANVAPLMTSLSQAIAQTQQMAKSTDSTIGRINHLNAAFLGMTQRLASLSGANKTAVATAAQYQQQLATLSALTVTSEKNFKGLADTTMKFARDFPVGMNKAIETTKALTTSGVTTTKEVSKLGKEFIKLQAASGEWGSGLVTDMLNLTKSFGNSTNMVKGFGDSLTTVSAKYGASASGVVAFAKSIAPVADMAGIGEAAVLGLSTAFSSMGEDGFRVAQATNKVLLDLNKSVRTGSPEIKEYAKAMNMSTQALTEMFTSSPDQTLVKFVDSVASKGKDAAQTLENLGISSVGTLKAFQALSKSDLGKIISDTQASFGNGATDRAAAESLGGVNDKVTQLQETVQQTAATAGKPFLGFLSDILGLSNGAASGIMSIVNALAGLGPLLPVLSAVFGVLKGIALVSVGLLAKSWIQNSGAMGSFKAGRADYASGLATAPARAAAGLAPMPTGAAGVAYKLGATSQAASITNTISKLAGPVAGDYGLMSQARAVTENPGGAARAFVRGIGNYQMGFYGRNDVSAPSENYRIAERQAMENNRFALRQGGAHMTLEEQKQFYGTNAKGYVNAATQANVDNAKFMHNNAVPGAPGVMPGTGSVPAGMTDKQVNAFTRKAYFETLGSQGIKTELHQAGMAARDFGKNLVDTTKKIGQAAQSINTKGQGGAGGAGTLFRTAEGNATMLGSMAPMFAIMGAMYGVGKFNENVKRNADQLRGTGMDDANSVYNNFATRAGLPGYQSISTTQTADVNAKADEYSKQARTGLEAVSINSKTGQEIANNAMSDSYKSSYTFGKKDSAKDAAVQAIALYNSSGSNPAVLSRLMQDLINQKGLTFTQQAEAEVSSKLTSADAARALPGKKGEKAMSEVVQNQYTDLLNTVNSQEGLFSYGDTAKQTIQLIRGSLKEQIDSGNATYGGGKDATLRVQTKAISDLIAGTTRAATDQGSFNPKHGAAKITSNIIKEELGFETGGGAAKAFSKDQFINDLLQANEKTLTPTGKYMREVAIKAGGLGASGPAFYDNESKAFDAIQSVAVIPNGMFTTPAEQESRKISKSKMGGSNVGTSNALYAAEDYAATFGKTVQQVASDTGLMGAASPEVQKSINAYIKQNDASAQAANAASVGNQVLAQSGNNTAMALDKLAAQFNNVNLTESSPQYSAAMIAYQQTAAINQMQQAGKSGTANMLENIGTGVDSIKSAPPTNKAGQDIAQSRVEKTQQGIAQAYSFAKTIANINHSVENQNKDFQVQMAHSERDYQRQTQWQEEDFQKNRSRQFKQFALQQVRAVQNFAKDFYNPFERVKTVRTLDASSTVGNLAQQNSMLSKQMSNVKKLKKLGLSDDTIRTLDLFNPNNAQQTARLLTDIENNLTLVGQLNKQSDTRLKLSTIYNKSEFNTAAEQQRADFLLQEKQSLEDHKKNVKKAAILHATQLSDMRTQLATQQARAYDDILNFGDNVTIAGDSAAEKLQTSLNAMPDVAGTAAKDTMAALIKGVKDNLGGIPEAKIKVSGAYVNSSGQTIGNVAIDGEVINYQGHKYRWNKDKNSFEVYHAAVRGRGAHYTTTSTIPKDADGIPYVGKWKGGYIDGPGTKTSDSIPAMLSKGEYVIKADSVDKYGVAMLDAINGARYASGGYVGGNEAMAARMANYTSSISNTSNHNYDHSTQINGPITVQANDPQQFLDQINARQKMQRLIQPVGN